MARVDSTANADDHHDDSMLCTCITRAHAQAQRVVQVTAYYATQFDALRELIVEGGQPVFLASLSRCKKWLSQGGKSNVYFAKTRDERYVVKQLTRSEKQSFLDFAPAYFRCIHDCMLHRRSCRQHAYLAGT